MEKLAELIAKGEITVKELDAANNLIERAKLVENGIKACKKTIMFPLGSSSIQCYSYKDPESENEAWAVCTNDGTFTCSRTHYDVTLTVGKCNLLNFEEVFKALGHGEFSSHLERFLLQQIDKAN